MTLFSSIPAMPITTNLTDAAAADEFSRLRRFKRAWQAYYGQAPKPLRTKPGQPDDNVRLNFNRVIVNKSASSLFGTDLEWTINDGKDQAATDYVEAAWGDERMTTLLELAINGGVTGHTFVKIVPGATASDAPSVLVLDPGTVSVTWDPHNIKRVVRYTIQYAGLEPETRKPRNYRQRIEPQGGQWRIIDEESSPDGGAWTVTGETPWPFAWSPVMGCQNLPAPNEVWGLADLEEDVLEVGEAVSRTTSNTNRILRFHAHPKTWGRGFTAKDLDIGPDQVMVIPGERGELKNLEMQSDLSSSLQFGESLLDALHEISRTPAVATGRVDNLGQLSGVALTVLYGPLVEATEMKRQTYGPLIRRVNRCLLEYGRIAGAGKTEIHWPQIVPSDPLTQRQVAQADKDLGVSTKTVLTQLKYDAELEAKQKSEEDASAAEQMLGAFERGQGGFGQPQQPQRQSPAGR